jgi:transketolase
MPLVVLSSRTQVPVTRLLVVSGATETTELPPGDPRIALMQRPVRPATDDDSRVVDLCRILAADAVQKAGNGHPGTAMALAPAAYEVYGTLADEPAILRHDPADPHWPGRDRFVLSCGHSSLTQYIQLALCGLLELEDLQQLRQWGSLTPGHPEHGHTAGVEVTTGPLGSGLATAVGMAIATRRERGLFDPAPGIGESPFDHSTWVFASDGDLEEGVSGEASSLAGHLRLGELIVLWDDNHISIEGDTSSAFSEDVCARYEAYGWHVQRVADVDDRPALRSALEAARAETGRPSFIAATTVLAWPAPEARNTGAAHGAALGAGEVRKVKEALGFDPDVDFPWPTDLVQRVRAARRGRGAALHGQWTREMAQWREREPERAVLWDRLSSRTLPEGWSGSLPTWTDGEQVATREASGAVLTSLAEVLPELWGGSADLAGSNNTTMKGATSFLPDGNPYAGADHYGRTLHFGVREHAMGMVLSGIALHGATRPYGGTFLVFSDYMRGAVRLAALQRLPVTYVWTHDSIGLGEDGPTHQPVEHLAALRAMPGLAVVRPADARETVAAWRTLLERDCEPTGLVLSRQKLPVLPGTASEQVARGAYVLSDAPEPQVVLMSSGSEVSLALDAAEQLRAEGIRTRVVSMPCWEWFCEQDQDYRDSVLPPQVRARVAVEAASSFGWERWVGDLGAVVGLDHFGASADQQRLYTEFGITAAAVVAAALASMTRATRG